MNELFVEFQELLVWGLPLVSGASLVWFVNKAKSYFSLNDNSAFWLTVALSVLMAVLTLMAQNILTPDTVTVANIAETVILVFGAATTWYFKVAAPRSGRRMADESEIVSEELS